MQLQGAAQEDFVETVKAHLVADDKFFQAFLSAKDALEENARKRRTSDPRTWWLDSAKW